jgi:hypothetical protein
LSVVLLLDRAVKAERLQNGHDDESITKRLNPLEPTENGENQ